jgi:hypothetical protein
MHKSVAFFPWVRIDDRLDEGRLRFIPYVRGEEPGTKAPVSQGALDRVIAAYVNPPRTPIHECTLIELDDWTIGQDMPLPGQIWLARTCIGMAGLSSRRLFRRHFDYCNFDTYQLVIQRFNEDSAGTFSFTARRRDGVVNHIWDAEGFVWRRPPHVPSHARLSSDEAHYAATLLATCAKDAGLSEALEEFTLANTDSPDVPVHAEVVMLKSAFEWLYGINENVEEFVRALAADVGHLLATPNEVPDSVRTHWASASPKATRPLMAWARDLCKLRGAAAHGKSVRHERFRWSPEAHLAFASVLFPLLVRHRLRCTGALPDDAFERARLKYIEHLLVPELFASQGDEEHPWSRFELRCRSAELEEHLRREIDRIDGGKGDEI